MYLRPRGVFEKFIVTRKESYLDARGNQRVEFKPAGDLFGVIASADPNEQEKFKALKHEVTHTIVQRLGNARANVGDVLINGARKFVVQAVDNPAGLGQWYIYYAKERFDL